MTMTLDHAAVDAAMQHLEESYGSLTPELKDEWADVLRHLLPGELRPVLERWVGIPKPYAVLDYILTKREPLAPPEPPPRAQRQITPTIREIIDKARADNARARARHTPR